jgi:hypothetical protein
MALSAVDRTSARTSSRTRTALVALFLLAALPAGNARAFVAAEWQEGRWHGEAQRITSSHQLSVGGAVLQVDFAAGAFNLPEAEFLARVQKAADAVTLYYGRFPVARARILIIPVAGKDGVLQGTTWPNRDGFPAVTRLRIGEHTTRAELTADWVMTHEMVHMALASLPDSQAWLEEGLATYVEPIARAQNGELTTEQVWGDMMRGMPQGEPGPGDQGMDGTSSWGRTYWGGAMFCLVADVEIHKQTHNRHGLQDALRAIVRAGGTIDSDWTTARILAVGDQATDTKVLEETYYQWSTAPVPIDLSLLWRKLGVQKGSGDISFNNNAPLASIRSSLTIPTATPMRNGDR